MIFVHVIFRITISKYHSWYLCQISLQIMLLPIQIWKDGRNLLLAINLAVKGLNCTCLPHYCHFKPSSWCLSPFRLPYYVDVSRPCHLSEFHPKGWFPLSRNFDVCMCLKFKFANKRGNVWKMAHKSKSWTLLNFTFKQNKSNQVSILFTRVKLRACACM